MAVEEVQVFPRPCQIDHLAKSGYVWDMRMKKAIIKRTADALEKLGIGSIMIGLFQSKVLGLWIGVACMAASYALTAWEAKL